MSIIIEPAALKFNCIVGCRCNQPIIDNAALSGSVFSEAFFDRGGCTRNYCHGFYCMKVGAFFGFYCNQLIMLSLLFNVNFCEFGRRENEAANIFVA